MQKDGSMLSSLPMPEVRIGKLIPVFACACGLTIANLYLAQPIAGMIGASLGLSSDEVGLTVTLTQIGYALGLLLLVPLGDLTENRQLVVRTLCGAALALAIVAGAPSASVFFAAALLVGIGATATQMLVPIAAHFAADEERGRVVGSVMSGLLVGVLLSRPVASLVADTFGWRWLFAGWAMLMLTLALALRRLLPERRPAATQSYPDLLQSLWALLREEPVLRRRALYQALTYGAFSLFWTAVPLHLLSASFNLNQRDVALFTLAGASGALIAPIAGRAGDRGWTRPATGLALAAILAAFTLSGYGAASLIALVAAAVLLDLGVWSSQVLGQRAIYALRPEARSRLNGLFIAIFFIGGAIGSALAGVAHTHGGWTAVVWIGAGCGVFGIALWLFEWIAKPGI